MTDTNGNVVKAMAYDTFGNLLSDSNPDMAVAFGFAGGLFDRDTGLVRFGYRDYDPVTGKWTAKDPIGFAGGDTNLYGYVLGDPVNFTDSVGLIQMSAGTNATLHLGLVGGHAHGTSSGITLCGRFGPGLFAGWGWEASFAPDSEEDKECSSESNQHDASAGFGFDLGDGVPGQNFGMSASYGTNGPSASISGFGHGIGFSFGVDVCYTYSY